MIKNKKILILVLLILIFIVLEIYINFKKKYRVNEMLEFDVFEYGECVYSTDSGFGSWDEVIFRIYKINKKVEFNKIFENKYKNLKREPISDYSFLDAEFYKEMEGKNIKDTYVLLVAGKKAKTRVVNIYIVYDGDDEYLFICG